MSTENYFLDKTKNITRFFFIDPKRIDWIDIAKGIAILLVIIGHTFPMGSTTRTFIYSFHMPLFFILSGYTYQLAKNKHDFRLHLRKEIRQLLLPAIMIAVIDVCFRWGMGNEYSFSSLWGIAQKSGEAFWWASGATGHSHPGLGVLWFLISLFWAKIILDGIHLLFPSKNDGYIYTFLGILGVFLGTKGKWLPQNFDVTCLAVLFMYLGMLWEKYSEKVKAHEQFLFFCAITFWLTCFHFNLYINLASRYYPYLAISIIEAVCGSYAFCCFCRALAANRVVTLVWRFIGMHTMLIFGIHCVDWIVRPLWNSPIVWQEASIRVLVLLLIGMILYSIEYVWRQWRFNLNQGENKAKHDSCCSL